MFYFGKQNVFPVLAAHCVAEENGQPVPKETVKVAVGKYYNKYMDERDTEAQYSDVL